MAVECNSNMWLCCLRAVAGMKQALLNPAVASQCAASMHACMHGTRHRARWTHVEEQARQHGWPPVWQELAAERLPHARGGGQGARGLRVLLSLRGHGGLFGGIGVVS